MTYYELAYLVLSGIAAVSSITALVRSIQRDRIEAAFWTAMVARLREAAHREDQTRRRVLKIEAEVDALRVAVRELGATP